MNFPILKTGAVAQYPLGTSIRFSTQAVRFLDGSQQKFRLYGGALRRWTVKFASLDETELSALIDFVDEQGSAPFSFIDPVSGNPVANCVISGDSFDATMTEEMEGKASLDIEERA
ncbi:MAG: DUF2460 domain-containing protein [Acidobacteriota bacterium]|nr:DUF2460 domain-containing protein [Acidobacteriota bacterium]